MILASLALARARRYENLHPGFRESLGYLEAFDPSTPHGRHEIANGLFCARSSFETVPAASKRLEARRKFIDIQFLARGFRNDRDFHHGKPKNNHRI